jgi:sigma-B regulation protein RsbU (phosphoserine phosphatase)
VQPELARHWLAFAQLAAGVLIFTAGVIQCGFWRPGRRDGRFALGLLGLSGVLYGARLLIELPEVQALFPIQPAVWPFLHAAITYVVLVPLVGFFELTFGGGWRQSIRGLRIAATVYAVCAIAIDGLTRKPGAAMAPNAFFVITAVALLIANSFRATSPFFEEGWRIVRVGLLIFCGFVLFQNLVDAPLLRGAWNVEWAGVLGLLACLGYVAVSHAMENDRRLHDLRHELETARQIQMSILPRDMPRIDGLEVAARYLPMAAVAGDFYDFLELGAGRLGVLVADVSGHGVPAALIASMVKVALVAQAPHGDDPARVLTGLNQIFCGRLERQFVTAAYAFVDAAQGRLRYAAAGHPPAILVRSPDDGHGDRVHAIAENGVMLGHFPDWTYTAAEQPFQPGDRLVLYTDGVIEATDAAGTFFDAERLCDFARTTQARCAEAFAGALVAHLGAWAGRSSEHAFEDDVTVVVVDHLPRG